MGKENRERLREQSVAYWSDPESRERHSEIMKACWSDPEYRVRLSEIKVAYYSIPENRARQSERVRAWWSNPENRARRAESMRSGVAEKRERSLDRLAEMLTGAPGYLVKRSGSEDGCVAADRVLGYVSSCLACPLVKCVMDERRKAVNVRSSQG